MGLGEQLNLKQELDAAGSREDALQKEAPKPEETVAEVTPPQEKPQKPDPTDDYWNNRVFPPGWKEKQKEAESRPRTPLKKKTDPDLIDYKSRQYKD